MNGSGGSGSSPTVQLHKLCDHLLGGRGDKELVTSHYKSALQLLTSTASHGHPGREEEVGVVEKVVKSLARGGRDREAATFTSLHNKLVTCSKDILRNRTSILALLHSLSERSPPSQQSAPFTSSLPLTRGSRTSLSGGPPTLSHQKVSLPLSSSQPSLAGSGFHPPLPPKPRSRPNSLYSTSTETDGEVRTPREKSRSQETAPGEQELVKALVFVFQGITGSLFTCDAGGRYSLAKGSELPSSKHCLVHKLCEVGRLYGELHSFTEKQAGEVSYGLVGHSFVTGLREELTEYYRLLASLEDRVREGGVTLLQLSVWTRQPLARLQLLVEVVRGVGGARGGALVSALYGFLSRGDPGLRECVARLLSACCRPLYTMLLRWLLDGSLEDPHNEFFICGEPGVQGEAIWHHKYDVRKAMVPRFLSHQWTAKILSTGKSINFLNSVCRDNPNTVTGRAGVLTRLESTDPASLYMGELDNPLLGVIGEAYRATSRHLLDVMFDKFQLMGHMAALRKYLLLRQGDIMRYLLDLLEVELAQPATQLFPHNLAGILETAIRGTNTQFEQQDVLERLDVRLLEIQAGDTGWDVFSLDYKVTGPIGVVFTPDTMTQYLMLFNTLWKAKRMEWVLSRVWKKLASLHKMARQLPELSPVLHQANLLASEMIHFIHQLAYYVTFEVMECGWDTLVRQIDLAESLDEIISAHQEFLATLVARALLDERSRDLHNQLRAIYDRILEFQNVANRIHDEAMAEWDARQTRSLLVRARTEEGEYGTSEERDRMDKERRRVYTKNKLASAKAQLRIVSQSYGDMVRTFLFQLACSNDECLQWLSFRLDFNQHYKRRDSRLSKPLTFSARMSSMSGVNSMTGSQMSNYGL